MIKITGIKSVDFKIHAFGHGAVNWNGPTQLTGDDGKVIDNHTLPKLRGYSNLSGRVKTESGFKYKKFLTDINFKETPLYISQNCIRHHLFKEQAFDSHYANTKNLNKVLASLTGLMRGYVVPSSQNKRTSPLLLEDFVDQLGNGNFEQMGKSGTKEGGVDEQGVAKKSASFFSKTTFGDTEYISFGSINIEQLAFISLDNKFGRSSMDISDGQGEQIAAEIVSFIQSLSTNTLLRPQANYHPNYVRKGTIFDIGEIGILLNNDAIHVLVETMLERIADLSIRQAKGYMAVDSLRVDYNDSNQMMRIKRQPSSISPVPSLPYAVYFVAK